MTPPSTRRARPSGARRKPAARRGGSPAPAQAGPPARPEPPLWTVPESGMPTFAELGLPEPVVRALAAEGFTAPFPIQAATLPDTLAARDLLGRGQTGSGKTLAFGLAMLSRLAGGRSRPKAPRGLVLVPTRELATQVVDALEPFSRALGLRTAVVVGGLSMTKQVAELRRGVDLLVATPGRLTDHTGQGTCDLSDVTITALDEADRMADMGFMPQVRAILDLTPRDGQRLLFSATLDGDVDALVRRYLTDPVTRSVASATAPVETMDHHVFVVDDAARNRVVAEIAARDGRTMMFVRTKHRADRLVRTLRRDGIVAGPLHGGKSQNARDRALEGFRSGTAPVLVATDVAARGIHIDDVGLVVHIDPPADHKAYLHRAGRTARAGEDGVVVTLVSPAQRREVDDLTRKAGVTATVTTVSPGSAALVEVAGAREPSGVPVAEPKKDAPAARRSGRASGNGRARGDGQRAGRGAGDGQARGTASGPGGRRRGPDTGRGSGGGGGADGRGTSARRGPTDARGSSTGRASSASASTERPGGTRSGSTTVHRSDSASGAVRMSRSGGPTRRGGAGGRRSR